jgi:hypothetical protein
VDDKIVLVQNGTYKGDHKHLKDTEVDTEAVAHVLAEEDDIPTALKKINAAYALVWYNVATRKLHVIRNSERPLWRTETTGGTIMMASEAEILLYAASREQVKLKDKPHLIPHEKLFTFEILDDGDHIEEVVEGDYAFCYKTTPWYRKQWPVMGQSDEEDNVSVHNLNYDAKNYKGDVKVKWSDFVHKLSDYHMDPVKATEANKALQESKNKVVVALQDYELANDYKDCTTFFVYGKILHPTEDEEPSPIVYWLVTGKTETEVYNMVTSVEFYHGTLCTPQTAFFLNKDNKRVGVVWSYVSGPEALPQLTSKVETADEIHVH